MLPGPLLLIPTPYQQQSPHMGKTSPHTLLYIVIVINNLSVSEIERRVQMNTKNTNAKKETNARISTAALMRLAGFSAMLAGVGIVVLGMFHPANEPASVTTSTWIIVHIFATSLGFFGVLGLAGVYTRQVEKAGWLGLTGFLLFSAWMALVGMVSFVEAVLLPQLASAFPPFVAGLMGMFTGVPSQVNLGALPLLWTISTPMLILGSLLFAIATFRARVLPRWAAALLALGSVMVPFSALVSTETAAKIIMVPMGLGLAWMGYALLTERRVKSAETMLAQQTANPEATNAA